MESTPETLLTEALQNAEKRCEHLFEMLRTNRAERIVLEARIEDIQATLRDLKPRVQAPLMAPTPGVSRIKLPN